MFSRKSYALFVIYLKEFYAYPAVSFIWVLADAQTALILPAVWLAAAPNGIGGMNRGTLVSYYLVSMTLSQFITCHLMWDIAFDIREGIFSSQIVRPISFFRMNIPRNFSWRVGKLVLFAPLAVFVFAVYGWGGAVAPVHFSWAALVAVFLAQFLSFAAAYCVSLVTLYTTEFFSVLRLYYIPEMFLSGRIVPLTTLPPWAQDIARWSHFRLTISFPTQIVLGQLSGSEIRLGLAMQVGWILLFLGLGHVILQRGMRLYTGAGM